MNHTLLFRLVSPTQVEWFLDGRCGHGTPAEWAGLAAGRRVVLIVPSETVSLTRATLPNRNKGTWLKALPYALEDSVADEVEELHFAVGAVRPDHTPVAVLRHAVLRDWLARCAQAGLAPHTVVPDCLLLPYTADAWSVLLEGERAVVRNGWTIGFACERRNLTALLTLALREAGDQAPDAWQMWGGPCPELAALKPISSPQEAAEPLRVFAAGLAQGVELDLLQGSYSRHAQAGRWLRPWRLAAALAAAWLGLQVAVQSAEYWRLNRERVRLQAEMEQLYRTAVPGAQRIVNPRAQLENRLRELRGGDPAGTEAAFLDLLRRGGRMLIEFPQIRLTGLRYNNQQLDLNLSGDSLETLERLRQKLTEQTGWEANMRTTKREDRIESLLTLRKTTS